MVCLTALDVQGVMAIGHGWLWADRVGQGSWALGPQATEIGLGAQLMSDRKMPLQTFHYAPPMMRVLGVFGGEVAQAGSASPRDRLVFLARRGVVEHQVSLNSCPMKAGCLEHTCGGHNSCREAAQLMLQ